MTAAAGPTENTITTGIRYANAGMICIASRIGVIARWKRSLRPATMPTGTPMRMEISTAALISASVCMLSSQRPSRANDTNAPKHDERGAPAAEAEDDQRCRRRSRRPR